MYEVYDSYNFSSSTCEFCGKRGSTKVHMGVAFCADCYKAITENNDDYFRKIGFKDATKGATAVVNTMNGPKRDSFEEWITTTNGFSNAEIEKYYGTVSGARSYLIGGLIGEGFVQEAELFRKSLSTKKKIMYEEAKLYGANAIIGMTYSVTTLVEGSVLVVVTGTAVKIKAKETSKE